MRGDLLAGDIKRFVVAFFFLIACNIIGSPVKAKDTEFITPANYGGTGIMETPTARFLEENHARLGFTHIPPYRNFYGAFSPLKGIEIDGRFTEILDVPVNPGDPTWRNYGNYKDKVADIKFRLLREKKYLPAIAVGIMDPHGTRIFSAQYVVASKQIYPLDFTLGFGNGRFGKKPLSPSGETIKMEIIQNPREFISDSQFFGGIQFALTPWLILMAEYSPIRYEKQTQDPGQKIHFPKPVPSPFNFGIRVKPWQWLETDFSYQRGEQFGVNVSVNFELGPPMVPLYDVPYKERPQARHMPLKYRIVEALEKSGFSGISIIIDGSDLWIETQNDKYYYTPRAIGMALRAIHEVLKEDTTVKQIHLILSDNDIPIVKFETTLYDLKEYIQEHLTTGEFLYLSHIDTTIHKNLEAKKTNPKWWDWGIKPSFQTLLNDPSGFFKYRLGALGWISINPRRGTSIIAGLEGYPLNNISSANPPMPQAVRSDLWLYKKEKLNMGLLMLEKMEKFPMEIYGRISAGYLELQYGGVDVEAMRPFLNGRLLVGLNTTCVKKREPDSVFSYKKEDYKSWYNTAFLKTRLNVPELESSLDIKAGQFLAGDRGVVFSVSKFINGIILSIWYSITDTSLFTDKFNRGYHDKGIGIVIPLRLFKGSDSKTSYDFKFSPWTRDVAQDIIHFHDLFDIVQRNTKVYLEKDLITKKQGLD
ncbi:MAG: YjbH domain-containing protein [Syntrophales bacterium]|nr:YjbH domain-containing protein [Syntrophales bacterium]